MTDSTLATSAAVDEQPVSAHDVGCLLAQLVRNDPSVGRLWVRAHPHEIETWLLMHDTDEEAERRLYAAVVPLYDRFPTLRLRFHVLNPGYYPHLDLSELIPDGAEEIPLRPA